MKRALHLADYELRPIATRLPEGLRRKLERVAKRHRRSMNAEIIHRLDGSFAKEDQAQLIRDVVEETVDKLGRGK